MKNGQSYLYMDTRHKEELSKRETHGFKWTEAKCLLHIEATGQGFENCGMVHQGQAWF